jgi:hypothetical protein
MSIEVDGIVVVVLVDELFEITVAVLVLVVVPFNPKLSTGALLFPTILFLIK